MNDGIIDGGFFLNEHNRHRCGNCGSASIGQVKPVTITLPEGIEPGNTLIAFNGDELHKFLGVTCGCYAKFHRQIAHIQGRMKK